MFSIIVFLVIIFLYSIVNAKYLIENEFDIATINIERIKAENDKSGDNTIIIDKNTPSEVIGKQEENKSIKKRNIEINENVRKLDN